MTTADSSQLSDLGKLHLGVKVDRRKYEDSFMVAKITNEGILGTDFLRMYIRRIDLVENRFLLDGQTMKIRNGLDRINDRGRHQQKKGVKMGRRIMAPGKVPAGTLSADNWIMEGLHKPPGWICVAWWKEAQGR